MKTFQTSLASGDGQGSCSASEAGSIITNPAFYRQKLFHQSFRSTMSDGEPDQQQMKTQIENILKILLFIRQLIY